MQSLRRLSSLRNAAAVPRLLARAALPPQPVRCCRLSTGAPTPPKTPKDTSKMRVSSGSLGYEANARPDAETVKRLGENAKMQGVVWQMWVPEAGIRFGDRCVPLPPSRALPRPSSSLVCPPQEVLDPVSLCGHAARDQHVQRQAESCRARHASGCAPAPSGRQAADGGRLDAEGGGADRAQPQAASAQGCGREGARTRSDMALRQGIRVTGWASDHRPLAHMPRSKNCRPRPAVRPRLS